MSAPDERPVSVAELLARNGTIGSPPVGGRRRRRGRNRDGLSVAELTGEIPVIQESPVVLAEDTVYEDTVYEEQVSEEAVYEEPVYEDTVYQEQVAEEAVYEEQVYEEVVYEYIAVEPAGDEYVSASVVEAADEPIESTPATAVGRSSGAEQMAYDPVDESVNLADLVDEPAGDVEELRSYLQASSGTLFSGGTVADDLARRGIAADAEDEVREDFREGFREDTVGDATVPGPPGGVGGILWGSAVAVLQSLLAVAFGAGLFIGFDQLWRWNNLVALVLSVLVVLTLAAAVRFVRKTEDIVSTLTAVAVGLLVTLGPLALQST